MYWIVFALLSGITATRWLDGPWWFLPLDALRLHWGYVALICAIVAIISKRWIPGACFVTLALINIAIIFEGLTPTPIPQPVPEKSLVLLQSNLLYKNNNHQGLFQLIEKEQPDIIVLVEFTKNWRRPLEENQWLTRHYPHRLTNDQTQEHLSQIGILSRYPLTAIPVHNLPQGASNWILKAIADVNGLPLDITAVHPYHPTNWWQAKQQKLFFEYLESTESQNTNPFRIMVGDFNAPHWFKSYIKLKQVIHLNDFSPSGHEYIATWPNSLPVFLRLPIDHFLFSTHIAVVSQSLGQPIGSDHYPVITRFILRDGHT